MAKPKEIIPTEYQEACTFVDWLELMKSQGKILDYCHVANESYGHKSEDILRGVRLKRVGRKRGVFDYLIFIAREHSICLDAYRALAVELKKRKGGKASKEQLRWREIYKSCGIPAEFCHGADEAIEFVESFIR